MKRLLCRQCARRLGNVEVALNLKMRGRAVSTFYCFGCLARGYDMNKERLLEWADFYKRNGCELFSREYVPEPTGEE